MTKTDRFSMTWRGAAGAIIALLLSLAVTPAKAQEAYTLRPGDILEFWVAQDEQLNRSVTIGPDGRLSLPLVGHLAVEGKTVDEVEADVVERLRRYYTDNLDIAVMLQPHPSHLPAVFVAGEVTEPGVFPFRPGMTVLHAITLAGGPYRTPLAASDVDRSILLKSEIDAAQKSGAELSFQIARLEAELAGTDQIVAPRNLVFELSEAQLAEIGEREQRLLDLRIAARTSLSSVSNDVRQMNERSIEAVRQQRGIIDRRRVLLEERVASSTTLVERGHMQRSQLLEQQGGLAELDGEAGELEAQIATAEASAIEEASREDVLSGERRVEIMTELNETRRDLEALKARLEDNRRALTVYERDSAGNSQEAALGYRIMRAIDGTSTEIDASALTALLPGDLVEVIKTTNAVSASVTTN
jgi:polysaccharide biosynthesis/export protein ExoF